MFKKWLPLFLVLGNVNAEEYPETPNFPAYHINAFVDSEMVFDMNMKPYTFGNGGYDLFKDKATIHTIITLSTEYLPEQPRSPYDEFIGKIDAGKTDLEGVILKVRIIEPEPYYLDDEKRYSGGIYVKYYAAHKTLELINNVIETIYKDNSPSQSLPPEAQQAVKQHQYIAVKYFESKHYQKETDKRRKGSNRFSFDTRDDGNKFTELAEFSIYDYYEANSSNLSAQNEFVVSMFSGNVPGAVSQTSLASNQVGLAYLIRSLKGVFPTHVELAKRDERRSKPEEGFRCVRRSGDKFTCALQKSDAFLLRLPSSEELPKLAIPYFMHQAALQQGTSEQDFQQFRTKYTNY